MGWACYACPSLIHYPFSSYCTVASDCSVSHAIATNTHPMLVVVWTPSHWDNSCIWFRVWNDRHHRHWCNVPSDVVLIVLDRVSVFAVYPDSPQIHRSSVGPAVPAPSDSGWHCSPPGRCCNISENNR